MRTEKKDSKPRTEQTHARAAAATRAAIERAESVVLTGQTAETFKWLFEIAANQEPKLKRLLKLAQSKAVDFADVQPPVLDRQMAAKVIGSAKTERKINAARKVASARKNQPRPPRRDGEPWSKTGPKPRHQERDASILAALSSGEFTIPQIATDHQVTVQVVYKIKSRTKAANIFGSELTE